MSMRLSRETRFFKNLGQHYVWAESGDGADGGEGQTWCTPCWPMDIPIPKLLFNLLCFSRENS